MLILNAQHGCALPGGMRDPTSKIEALDGEKLSAGLRLMNSAVTLGEERGILRAA